MSYVETRREAQGMALDQLLSYHRRCDAMMDYERGCCVGCSAMEGLTAKTNEEAYIMRLICLTVKAESNGIDPSLIGDSLIAYATKEAS